jgi:hypothetical protein
LTFWRRPVDPASRAGRSRQPSLRTWIQGGGEAITQELHGNLDCGMDMLRERGRRLAEGTGVVEGRDVEVALLLVLVRNGCALLVRVDRRPIAE